MEQLFNLALDKVRLALYPSGKKEEDVGNTEHDREEIPKKTRSGNVYLV